MPFKATSNWTESVGEEVEMKGEEEKEEEEGKNKKMVVKVAAGLFILLEDFFGFFFLYLFFYFFYCSLVALTGWDAETNGYADYKPLYSYVS